jgi:hypothetical protein
MNDNEHLTEMINYLEKEVKSLKVTVAYLHEQLHNERIRQFNDLRDHIALAKKAKELSNIINKKNKKRGK